MTSELRELVWVPIASSLSRITTSRPARASARATARPTTPAPITTASSFSTAEQDLEHGGADAGHRRGGGHRSRRAVEDGGEEGADQRAGGEADRANQRGSRARGGRKGRERGRGRVGHDQRGTEEEHGEGDHDGEPVVLSGPGECSRGEAAEQHDA